MLKVCSAGVKLLLYCGPCTLPVAAVPAASYVPFKIHGDTLILSGVICIRDGVMTHTGQVGGAQTVESGYEAAKVCALNILASIKLALGQLDRVQEFLFVSGYVNAVSGFDRRSRCRSR